MNELSTDIIVVGAGPTGLSFCRALAASDLNITLIERQSESVIAAPPFDGREIALTHDSKDILEKLAILPLIEKNEIHRIREAKVINGNDNYSLHFACPTHNSRAEKIDSIGYFIANDVIRKAAYRATTTQKNLNIIYEQTLTNIENDSAQVRVTLSDKRQITAKLLIAADSRFSSVRRDVGIATDVHDFGRTVIVFRLEHEISNDHVAFECFFYGSTLALLPLSDNLTNCVLTLSNDKARQFLRKSALEIAADVAAKVKNRFGKMELVSKLYDYQLVGVHARSFHSTRCALIGDAACGMHPVTAQGFNLGLTSVDILSHLLLRQHGQGKDIAAPQLLAKYTRQHRQNTLPLYHGTNLVVKIFTAESAPAKLLRHVTLRGSNNCLPFKNLITRQLTG